MSLVKAAVLLTFFALVVASCREASAPAPGFERRVTTWEQFDEQLQSLASEVSFLSAALTDKGCFPINSIDPDIPRAVGSTFKLYVLGELGRQIESGEAAWEERLAIRNEWKSLPSGAMQKEREGTQFTLARYTEAMISVSDNTATDHLLFRLGRDNVEASQARLGHGNPKLNTPFLSTREAFILKLSTPEQEVADYLRASEADKRKLLDTKFSKAPLPGREEILEWTSPRRIDSVEWHATNEDLCRAMANLKSMGERKTLSPLAEALAINPGVEFFRFAWAYAGFKGGEEPGVLNMTWLLQRVDHLWFVISASLNDPENVIDQNEVVSLMTDAASLIAFHGRNQ